MRFVNCFLLFASSWMSSCGFAKICTAPLEIYALREWEWCRNHQGFYPYVCEFGYRTLADHVIDPNHIHFDPSRVKTGDILYVAVWYLEWFIDEVHDRIKYPYILITCDVGSWLPSYKHLRLAYDPKVVFWFAKNMLFTNHTKLFQIPMGQFYYLWASSVAPVIGTLHSLVANPPAEKDILLYLNHQERDHGRRLLVSEKFYNQSYCFNRNRPKRGVGFEQFWNEIARSKFVLSPLGLEVDCTRTWECFVLGAIPIVEHSYLDPLYEGLPILLIHNWDEINEEFLYRKFAEIHSQPRQIEKAYFDYWANFIHEKQAQVRRGEVAGAALEANNFTKADIKTIKNILSKYKKASHPMIYRGNFTCLRAFQLAKKIETIPKIELYDAWCKKGYDYLEKYSSHKSLVSTDRVKMRSFDAKKKDALHKAVTYFLDLTHFRHALNTRPKDLEDFAHSLEFDVQEVHESLSPGSLLMGNMAHDGYVRQVLERLQKRIGLNVQFQDNFWYSTK